MVCTVYIVHLCIPMLDSIISIELKQYKENIDLISYYLIYNLLGIHIFLSTTGYIGD